MEQIELNCCIFLSLCLSLAIKGYKMPLEAKDLWSLNQRDSSKVMVPRLLKEWEKEQVKAKRYGRKNGGGNVDFSYMA